MPQVYFDLKERITPYRTTFWGVECDVHPALASEIFGDDQRLIFFTPLASRPVHHSVRVDSSWAADHFDVDGTDHICDHSDDIFEQQLGLATSENTCSDCGAMSTGVLSRAVRIDARIMYGRMNEHDGTPVLFVLFAPGEVTWASR